MMIAFSEILSKTLSKVTFSKTYSEIEKFNRESLIEKLCSHMTPESCDVIILVTWSKFYISKM